MSDRSSDAVVADDNVSKVVVATAAVASDDGGPFVISMKMKQNFNNSINDPYFINAFVMTTMTMTMMIMMMEAIVPMNVHSA